MRAAKNSNLNIAFPVALNILLYVNYCLIDNYIVSIKLDFKRNFRCYFCRKKLYYKKYNTKEYNY